MSTVKTPLDELPINDKGYLQDFHAWNPDVAKAMAEEDELQLTDCHWTAFEFLRDYYATFDMPPSARTMIKEIGEHLATNCDRHTLERLFPRGGCKQACRLAGLPESFCYAC